MGQSYTYICRTCGKDKDLTIGAYGCKGWDKKTQTEILEGKYGKKAKDALSNNPKSLYHFQSDICICECGYVGSYDSLIIRGKEPVDFPIFFQTMHRCPWCRKMLRPIEYFPLTIPCRCGSEMDINRKSLFRWRWRSVKPYFYGNTSPVHDYSNHAHLNG